MYDEDDSFIEFAGCQIFSRMTFNVTGTAAGLNLDFAKFSFSAAYDRSNVVQGNQVYTWSTNKFNWIQFEGVTGLSDLITYAVREAPLYLSASPSSPPPSVNPSASPASTPPSVNPSVSPSSTTAVQETNPNPIITTSGSVYLSQHVIYSVILLFVAIAFV